MLLEKSLRAGAEMFVGASSYSATHRPYQLLGDLIMSDEVLPADLLLGHRCLLPAPGLTPGTTAAAAWGEELKGVFKEVGAPASLKTCFVTAALGGGGGDEGGREEGRKGEGDTAVSAAATSMDDLAAAVALAGMSTDSLLLGVDVPAERLAALDAGGVEVLAGELGQAGVQVLTLGASPFCMDQARQLSAWARDKGVLVVATDVLRVHARRPGQLSHIGRNGNTDVIEIAQAVEDFKKAMDICMHTEKKYLTEMAADSGVDDPTALCWGHVLAQAQGSILFPEEWAYIQATQAEPSLMHCHGVLKEGSSATKDFALLHAPLTKFLFAAFDRVLQARKQDLIRHVSMDVVRTEPVTPHEYAAALVQASVLPDHLCLTGIDFNAKNIDDAATKLRGNGVALHAQLQALKDTYNAYDSAQGK
jgi:hypothetical protein